MKIKIYLYFLLMVGFLLSCGKKKQAEITSNNSDIKDTSTVAPGADTKLGLWEHKDIVMVLSNYDIDPNKRIVSFMKLGSKDEIPVPLFDINIGKFDGLISTTKYNASGAHYSVQFKNDLSKVYLCIENIDEMEGIFNFCKLVEYDVAKKKFREVISFTESVASWYFFEQKNIIYWDDYSTKSLLSINLDSNITDTILGPKEYSGSVDYQLENDQLTFLFSTNDTLTIWKLSPEDSKPEKIRTIKLGPYKNQKIGGYSSYRKGYMVETFSDFKTDKGFILHTSSTIKKKYIDFINFGTNWTDDDHFTLEMEDSILIFNKELEVVQKLETHKMHVYQAFPDAILVVFLRNNKWEMALYSTDFLTHKNLSSLDEGQLIHAWQKIN